MTSPTAPTKSEVNCSFPEITSIFRARALVSTAKSSRPGLDPSMSWSWDEMWTWKQPISKDYSVSFDGKSLSLQHQLQHNALHERYEGYANPPPFIATLTPFALCRQIHSPSINAASAAVSVTASSRLAPGCLGLGFLFCWLSGWGTFTCAPSSNLAAGTKSVLAVLWRCCGCYSASLNSCNEKV